MRWSIPYAIGILMKQLVVVPKNLTPAEGLARYGGASDDKVPYEYGTGTWRVTAGCTSQFPHIDT